MQGNKRYVTEMCNDFERKMPEKATEIGKVKNAYIRGLLTEVDVIRTLCIIYDTWIAEIS